MSIRNLATALAVALGVMTGAQPALAQSTGPIAPTGTDSQAQVASAPAGGPETLVLPQARGVRPPPLGSEMFGGSALGQSATGGAQVQAVTNTGGSVVDPNHILRPGDRIRVTLWGLVNQEQELTIDAQGNVVVPGVGPVQVAGLSAAAAPGVIERASRRIYSTGVQIYSAATTAAAVQVLVTGPVARPGAYSGASDDAVVLYLLRAGGIDAERGSYRRVRVVRAGETIVSADLYEFLRAGLAPRVSLRNGDAIVVEDQGSTVAVTGDVRSSYSFELLGQGGLGAEIMQYARPRPGATYAAVIGTRDGAPFSTYLSLQEFAGFLLQDGDQVQFETDSRAAEVLVRVEGAHQGPSVFSVPRGTTIGAVLQQVHISQDADMGSIHLRRDAVRVIQKNLLNEALDRLERTTLLAPSRTSGEASARASQAQFVSQYVAQARLVEPLGILPLNGRDPATVLLENGDVIVIPQQSQIVSIAGEVQAPQSVVANGPDTVTDYVELAGGFSQRADRRRILVFKQDGQIRAGNRAYPGDRILVLSKPESTLLPLIGDLAAITLGVSRLAR